MCIKFVVTMSFAVWLAAVSAADAQTLAFPGAQGFGADATGGRGGEVYHVTTLADAGPGSFRDAVSREKRIVVFDVAGYIDLKSPVSAKSDLTIAGQSAPGEGIAARNYEVSFSKSHNVIVRFFRFRQGLTPGQEKKYALGLTEGSRMIFDHCSIQWGRWDCIGLSKSRDITFQHCIIGPGVAPQRFGCLCESDNVTFLANLWISNHSRNPKSKGAVQFVNNVVYNWGVCGYVGGHSGGDHAADLLNNYFIAGPASGKNFAGEFKTTDHIFQAGNYLDANKDGLLNGQPITNADFGQSGNAPTLVAAASVKPPVAATPDSAEAAYRKIVAGVGCSLARDGVDKLLIADLTSLGHQGKMISDPAEVGGFGEIKGGPAKIRAGSDTIPEAWKAVHGSNASKSGENPRNAYSDIENFLNDLAGDPATPK